MTHAMTATTADDLFAGKGADEDYEQWAKRNDIEPPKGKEFVCTTTVRTTISIIDAGTSATTSVSFKWPEDDRHSPFMMLYLARQMGLIDQGAINALIEDNQDAASICAFLSADSIAAQSLRSKRMRIKRDLEPYYPPRRYLRWLKKQARYAYLYALTFLRKKK